MAVSFTSVAVLAVAVTATTACASQSSPAVLSATGVAGTMAPKPVLTATPLADGGSDVVEVTTTYPVLVNDDGTGARLCLGGRFDIHPPSCGEVALSGWDWDEVGGDQETSGNARWGEYLVEGEYDAPAGLVKSTSVTPANDFHNAASIDEESSMSPDFSTPCATPPEGWRAIAGGKTSDIDLNNAADAAEAFRDTGRVWVDHIDDPSDGVGAAHNPLNTILNVSVVGDLASTETKIRELWSGPLCVSQATRTTTQLVAIQQELHDRHDVIGSGIIGNDPVLSVGVLYDDGSIQAEIDEQYGAGIVIVWSALTPL